MDLGNLLECIICGQRIRPTQTFVRQCTNGHFHCSDCISELRLQNPFNVRCAVCRINFGEGVRNPLAQAYLEIEFHAAPIKCKFDKCYHRDFLTTLTAHEDHCSFRKSLCLGNLSKICDWRGPLTDLPHYIKERNCAR